MSTVTCFDADADDGQQAAAALPRVRMVPFAPERNEYLRLLADKLCEAEVARVVEDALAPSGLVALGDFDIAHTHWPEHVFARPASGMRRATRAALAAGWFAFARATWAMRRVPYVHTFHNARPHDPAAPAVQGLLLTMLVRSADVLIVHSRLAEETARRDVRRRGPIIYAPHGHYAQALEPLPGESALREHRRSYGITDSAPVVLLFGQLRADKRLCELVASIREWSREAWAVVAGEPRHPEPAAALRAMAALDQRLILLDRRIAEEEVPRLHGIADLTLQGQRLSLASGTALLSLSLGVPIAVPLHSASAELGVPPAVVPYSGHPGEAMDVLLRYPRALRRRAAREAALKQDWALSAERHREAYELAGSIAARRHRSGRRR
jgi:hypothetical protein